MADVFESTAADRKQQRAELAERLRVRQQLLPNQPFNLLKLRADVVGLLHAEGPVFEENSKERQRVEPPPTGRTLLRYALRDQPFTWHRAETQTQPFTSRPRGRSGHSAFTVGNGDPRIFIHGGAAENAFFSETYFFHTGTSTWGRAHFYFPPKERAYHTMIVTGPDRRLARRTQTPRLWCFGGLFKGSILEEVEVVPKWSAPTERVASINRIILPKKLQDTVPPADAVLDIWEPLETFGEVPLGRCSHTATAVGSRHVVVIGGWNSGFSKDVYVFDMETATWHYRYVTTEDDQTIAPRAGHSATLLPGKKMLVFGGMNKSGQLGDLLLLDMDKWEWVPLKPEGQGPGPRSGHTATFDGKRRVFIFGGWNGVEYLNDLHVLDLSGNMRWENVATTGSQVEGRCGHTATLMGRSIFIFGGWAKSGFKNDIYRLETSKALGHFRWAARAALALKHASQMGQVVDIVMAFREGRQAIETAYVQGMRLLITKQASMRGRRDYEALREIDRQIDDSMEKASRVLQNRSIMVELGKSDMEQQGLGQRILRMTGPTKRMAKPTDTNAQQRVPARSRESFLGRLWGDLPGQRSRQRAAQAQQGMAFRAVGKGTAQFQWKAPAAMAPTAQDQEAPGWSDVFHYLRDHQQRSRNILKTILAASEPPDPRIQAAVCIQAHARGMLARRMLRRNLAAIRIQAASRGWLTRLFLLSMGLDVYGRFPLLRTLCAREKDGTVQDRPRLRSRARSSTTKEWKQRTSSPSPTSREVQSPDVTERGVEYVSSDRQVLSLGSFRGMDAHSQPPSPRLPVGHVPSEDSSGGGNRQVPPRDRASEEDRFDESSLPYTTQTDPERGVAFVEAGEVQRQVLSLGSFHGMDPAFPDALSVNPLQPALAEDETNGSLEEVNGSQTITGSGTLHGDGLLGVDPKTLVMTPSGTDIWRTPMASVPADSAGSSSEGQLEVAGRGFLEAGLGGIEGSDLHQESWGTADDTEEADLEDEGHGPGPADVPSGRDPAVASGGEGLTHLPISGEALGSPEWMAPPDGVGMNWDTFGSDPPEVMAEQYSALLQMSGAELGAGVETSLVGQEGEFQGQGLFPNFGIQPSLADAGETQVPTLEGAEGLVQGLVPMFGLQGWLGMTGGGQLPSDGLQGEGQDLLPADGLQLWPPGMAEGGQVSAEGVGLAGYAQGDLFPAFGNWPGMFGVESAGVGGGMGAQAGPEIWTGLPGSDPVIAVGPSIEPGAGEGQAGALMSPFGIGVVQGVDVGAWATGNMLDFAGNMGGALGIDSGTSDAIMFSGYGGEGTWQGAMGAGFPGLEGGGEGFGASGGAVAQNGTLTGASGGAGSAPATGSSTADGAADVAEAEAGAGRTPQDGASG